MCGWGEQGRSGDYRQRPPCPGCKQRSALAFLRVFQSEQQKNSFAVHKISNYFLPNSKDAELTQYTFSSCLSSSNSLWFAKL